MLNFLTQNNAQIAWIITIFTGLFAFVKWLDSRKRTLENERYNKYMRLIGVLAGSKVNNGSSRCFTEQIAAAWFLLEYKEYYKITLKILDNNDLEKMSAQGWSDFVAPQVRLLVAEIKRK